MYMGDLGRTFQLIYIIMEHLNCECKQAISGLGANITDALIQHIGKCIGRLCSTISQYNTDNCVKPESSHHTYHSTEIDLKNIVEVTELFLN